MSNKRDYYNILGVNKNATEKEIKRAYRKRAMQYHPDKYEGDKKEGEEKFKELNEAYSILSESEKRQIYDRFGHAGLQGAGNAARGADPFDFFSSIFDFDLGSLFGGGFGSSRQRGRGRSRRGPQKGDDAILDLQLTFEESFSGVSKKVKMPFYKACPTCRGSGGQPDTGMSTCNNCHGVGIVEKQTQQGFFVQISREPCRNCKGRGQVPKKKCKTCKGKGITDKREVITVRIPKGIDHGEAVRVEGKGRPSMDGGLPGDLIFRIHLKEHSHFERNGLDVYMKIPVDYPTMVLGGTIDVPIISENDDTQTTRLKIPSGAKLNDVLKKSGVGFQRKVRNQNVKGDAYFVVDLHVPKKLNKKQKELLKELQLEFTK